MFLTKRQNETLATAPIDEEYYPVEGWHLEQVDDLVEVKFRYMSVSGWSRYITPDGSIKRLVDGTDEFVDATFEPLRDYYVATGKRYWYEY